MPRVKPLVLLNSLAILVIAAAFVWAVRLPAPDAVLSAAPNPSVGIRAVAAGVTVALPINAEPDGHPEPGGAANRATPQGGQNANGTEPASRSVVEPLSSDPTTGTAPLPAAGWIASTAARTGIPSRALQAYAAAASAANASQPACTIGWNTLAAIGLIESGHGTHGGGSVMENGASSRLIIGPQLNGDGYAPIPDTDGGALDGDTRWDHAVGPMQFIPSTWRTAGRDGNGDGIADPTNIDDAALSAAIYLCSAGRNLSTGQDWTDAIMSYNHSADYVAAVRQQANAYAALAEPGG
ncbi:lytic transglycosylase domain-containing protein [Arthrobacter sp. NPDC058097]|uniref:lytic transglycosylase domain-containing protein n=1 Tax=Arthrobacter sp. NPDC058097 TaxID=3346340 RepID=UPI0036D9D0C0